MGAFSIHRADMASLHFLIDGGEPGCPTVLLAHGACAPMDTPWMHSIIKGLAVRGFRVVRFEFAYMAARRTGGTKRPPPKIELLQAEFRAAIASLSHDGPLIIGGKSMGGRVASLISDDLHAAGRISGLLCLGYPFHPRGKPETRRTEHLADLRAPTLICQGTRDPFGTREEVSSYNLSDRIVLKWVEDGDHDLKTRKSVTRLGPEDSLMQVCAETAAWWSTLEERSTNR
ncbi:alpha/beta hydrolase [Antarctobacter heliothermus]|uniref:Alpha/beta hydrolase n=2 Tax=Antarctobacter heliothermus TaxID=74033 RepID=A0A222E2H0_9RHOB|nr:alpha/beta hydrolase [Antarctobacter heliothermus]